ncbi:hypothetical protein K2173_001545 [Erythroxylum novogranatense]|uniref:Retrovirus-related Pol polyprotein from transposon TNT 1-94 n=1 Tax=Erythroxylum novogranatense TaxID=1862640 RepID=A0AAV8T5R1_9ROSI|nr:hypothetical protein K2173_001545 [Erythroxylum novogranatense]
MPSYAKFLKEILSNKRRLEEYATVKLNEECSAILSRKLPPKLKDPGSFTYKALMDLGASINLMPLSVFRKLGLTEPKPTTISLQLADRSITYPRGIIEDVLVKVEKFIFPVDFLVFDMEEDIDNPIILGRPFMATAQTIIDDYMLTYKKSTHLEVIGYSDSDYADCIDSQKSTFGYMFLLAGGAVSWKSGNQFVIATSTMEAEFVACFEATVHGLWMRNFILGLGLVDSIARPLRIYCDNSAVVFFSKNDKYSKGAKHIDLKYLSVKEEVQKHNVSIEHIGTDSGSVNERLTAQNIYWSCCTYGPYR